MATSLFFVWKSLVDALFSKREFLDLGMGPCWEEGKKGLEGCSFGLVLDCMEGEKSSTFGNV